MKERRWKYVAKQLLNLKSCLLIILNVEFFDKLS